MYESLVLIHYTQLLKNYYRNPTSRTIPIESMMAEAKRLATVAMGAYDGR